MKGFSRRRITSHAPHTCSGSEVARLEGIDADDTAAKPCIRLALTALSLAPHTPSVPHGYGLPRPLTIRTGLRQELVRQCLRATCDDIPDRFILRSFN